MNWWHWHTEPELIGGLLLLAWLYAIATGPLRPSLAPGKPYPRREAACFYSGLALLYLSVGSPLDLLGEVYLFSAHMLQHILVIYPVGILLVTGIPGWLADIALKPAALRATVAFLSRPPVAGLLFTFVLTAWHVPALYDWALRDRLVHNIEHLTMLLAALCVWWAVFNKSARTPAAGYGTRILLVFCIAIAKVPVAAYLTFAPDVLYPTYELAPRIFGLSAMEDQILGGAIMTLLAKFGSVFLMAWFFYRWYRSTERPEDFRYSIESLAPGAKAPRDESLPADRSGVTRPGGRSTVRSPSPNR